MEQAQLIGNPQHIIKQWKWWVISIFFILFFTSYVADDEWRIVSYCCDSEVWFLEEKYTRTKRVFVFVRNPLEANINKTLNKHLEKKDGKKSSYNKVSLHISVSYDSTNKSSVKLLNTTIISSDIDKELRKRIEENIHNELENHFKEVSFYVLHNLDMKDIYKDYRFSMLLYRQ